jgi:hypothetical protein
MVHHGAPMPLGGFTRDAAPSGSVVGDVGGESFGYSENNRTMHPLSQAKVGGTDPQREDGAIRSVLCVWNADAETQTVEQDGLKYLLMWTPLQSGEGVPENAITAGAISRSATTMNDPEKSFADPPIGPRAAMQDAHRQMFDRVRDHDSKTPPAARRALAAIKRGTDTLESINAANVAFWSGKK